MKKFVCTMMVLVTMAIFLVNATAEVRDVFNVIRTDILEDSVQKELNELQEEVEKAIGTKKIDIRLTETKPVSIGEAKYNSPLEVEEDKKTWFDKTIDWITFWN